MINNVKLFYEKFYFQKNIIITLLKFIYLNIVSTYMSMIYLSVHTLNYLFLSPK